MIVCEPIRIGPRIVVAGTGGEITITVEIAQFEIVGARAADYVQRPGTAWPGILEPRNSIILIPIGDYEIQAPILIDITNLQVSAPPPPVSVTVCLVQLGYSYQ